LGHNHPVVHEALQRFLESGQPALNTQGSLYYYPSLLARKLSQLFGEFTGKHFKVQFANSGTEATEIALHHALYEWRAEIEKMRDEQLQRYGSVEELNARATWVLNMKLVTEATAAVVVVNNCFHGYTASARSLLNSKKQRRNFSGLLRLFPLHVDDQGEHWRDQVERYKADYSIELSTIVKENDSFQVKTVRVSTIIASIVEPVRGEGGIYPLRWEVADFLSTQSFPLIADEIQCGLGRTGTIPSYPGASYYLLGKSLGGGYEKIAAVLIDDKRFKSSFPQYYNSTFANGEMAACAGLAALETIVREQFAAIASRKGHELKSRLFRLAGQYPDVVESVQGEGLMIGIHFNKAIGKANILLRALCEHELLGYLLSGWMFHTKDIRVLPSLSKPDSIRLEPSVYITGHDMDELMGAVEELCQHLRSGNMYELFRFLMNNDPYLDKLTKLDAGKFPVNLEDPQPGAIRVGFIGNFTQPARELTMVEVGLSPASETGLRILFEKMQTLLEGKPIRLFSKNLMQGRVHFTFYILPFDTAHLEMVQRFGKKRYYVARIQEAVDRLVEEGARFISLGAHTSIISGNGLFVSGSGRARILTGNTLTVASCLYHARQYLARLRRRRQPVTIAITGANGNIGSGLAGCFGDDEYADALIFLIGNNLNKLERLRQSLFSNDRRVVCTTDLFALREANIILSCTNTNDPLIFAHHLDPEEQVFIIDIAVPGAVSDEVRELPNVEFNRDASTVYLPDDPGIAISTHTPVGKVFCCAAEVMLAAMYDVRLPLVGHVHPASIKKMMELAMREGLFDKKSYALPI
jgi:acetylornithine/succinyldiaminopimelate/putrescine aminotransferase